MLPLVTGRRLKHWGWGYEDQAPSEKELEEAAAGIRERFGFGGEVEEPVPLEEVEVRASRLKAPADLGDLFTDEKYERVVGRWGRPIGTWCGGSGGNSRIRPIWWRCPGRVGDRDGALLGRGRGGGGRPVRRRDQRGRWGRGAAGGSARSSRSTCGGWTGCWRSMRSRWRRGSRPGPPGRAGGAAARARADPAPLPAVVRVRDARRLDRDPGRRALRHPLHPHRRPGRVGAGDHPARDLGEPAAAGLGRGTVAGPGADRLGGNPRRDRRGLDAGAAAARVQGLLRGRVRRLPRRGRRRARDLPVGPLSEQLPPARRDGGRHDRRRQRREEPAGARLRVGPPPRGRPDGPGPGDRPRPRRQPQRRDGPKADASDRDRPVDGEADGGAVGAWR